MTSIVMLGDLTVTDGRASERTVSPRSTEYSCAECGTVIYVASTRFPSTVILRPGTLDRTEVAAPQAHIWVRRKQSWLELPSNVPRFEEQYERELVWPAASLARIGATDSVSR
jgi:hypothetical protein